MYSKDFKKCAVEFKLNNHNFEEVFKIFRIAQSTLYAWIKEYKEGFPEKPKRTCEKKINKEKLKKKLEEKPDSELAELAKPFGCSAWAVSKALKKMKFTRKKRLLRTQKNQKKSEMNFLKN
jgi:transposase